MRDELVRLSTLSGLSSQTPCETENEGTGSPAAATARLRLTSVPENNLDER